MIEKTQQWVEKDRRYVWHALSGYDPDASTMVVAQADGAWITDTDGNRYLDGMSGLWCVNVGYGREELARAAYEQLKELPYYPLLKSHLPAIRLGEKLNEWLEDNYIFLFSNSCWLRATPWRWRDALTHSVNALSCIEEDTRPCPRRPPLHVCNTARVMMPEEGMVLDASSCPPSCPSPHPAGARRVGTGQL